MNDPSDLGGTIFPLRDDFPLEIAFPLPRNRYTTEKEFFWLEGIFMTFPWEVYIYIYIYGPPPNIWVQLGHFYL